MHRIKVLPVVVPATIAAILVVACGGGGGEKAILDTYFQVSRLRDNLTLGNIATVAFDPRRDGEVRRFEVTSVGTERTQTLQLRTLAGALGEAQAADGEFTKRKKAYQDATLEAIDRVLKAERQKTKLRGNDLEVQAAWTKWRNESAQVAKRLSDARTKLAAERAIAEVSASDQQNLVDVTKFDGELFTKDVTITAQVKTPSGEVTTKTLVVSLQRAKLRGPDGKELVGRWIVTQVRT